MSLILAVDLGGTKAHTIIADYQGNILGFGDDKEWVYQALERRIYKMVRIRFATDKALADAGLSTSNIDRVSASCSGADWPFELPIGVRQLRETLGVQNVSYFNDCIGALRGGTEMIGHDCAVICLGTGANCAVYNKDGQSYEYGYYLKNVHQGGEAIGRFIVDAVVDASVGLAPATELTRLLLDFTGFSSVEEFYMLCTTGRTEDESPKQPLYKDFCPLLFEAIRLGDAVSLKYIELFCADLANYVVVAAKKLNIVDRPLPVVISGGVCKGDNIIQELIEKRLKEKIPGAYCINARFEPVIGALLMELDRTYPQGIPVGVMETLERCCTERKLFRDIGDAESVG
ncbi:BadF-type ATPase [Paenibacillus sp. UNC496MF]|uniref:N-acetylglucosamine kinase n=1 Tax=Paenibacillus sp. UNC496MF TaxID=1502753 RepID=UPI0008F1AA2C|nr:BadF/BadG/BcrA/BcrD ATPase family protein [Paenibacillus sp. UNC496MF]SFJ54781.1 BadF-type ATPase [Paenibacillus sp. UNC496MF]